MSTCLPDRLVQAEEAYRLWASAYDAAPNPLLSLEERSLAPLLQPVAGCDAVDLGCGTGRWLARIERLAPRSLTGVDLSTEMLECASAKLLPSTRLLRANCIDTPLASASSDWILASFLLSYVEDRREFAREAARIARPGAMVLLSDVHPATKDYGWRRTFRCAQQTFEIQTYPYEISDLRQAMDCAGFETLFLQEHCFGEEEEAIFLHAGRQDLYAAVLGLPVLFVAGYRRRRT